MSSSINNQQHKQQFNIKELSNFQWTIYNFHFILAIYFTFEIIFLLAGYIGLFQLKIKTGFWFIYEMFWRIIVPITPFILIIYQVQDILFSNTSRINQIAALFL